jgi:hypothetical protein
MPMGIVSDDEFENEVVNSALVLEPEPVDGEVIDLPIGRGKGNNNVPNELRNIIGEQAILEGRGSALALAKDFGISPSSVAAYSRGATSEATYHNRPNLKHLNNLRDRVSRKASTRIIKALDRITDDKLDNEGAKNLTMIAAGLSSVVKNMAPEPETESNGRNAGVQFVVFSPPVKVENQFDVVIARE